MASLPIHERLRAKVESGETLNTYERIMLRREYDQKAPGVSQHPSMIEFLDQPREAMIGHLARVWNVGWTALHYSQAMVVVNRHVRLLDVGAGRAELMQVVTNQRLARGSRIFYTGVDLNVERLDLFNDLYRKSDRHRYLIADLRKEIPVGDASHDVVVSTEFLEHVTRVEAQQVLREVYRVLKPGGYFVLTTPDADSQKDPIRSSYHLYEWHHQELREELEAVGYEVVDNYWHFVPSKLLERWIPPQWRGRVNAEWIRAGLGPASGLPGAIQQFVLKKPKEA